MKSLNSIRIRLLLFEANLSALVYQHTVTALALPIKLILPTVDVTENFRSVTTQQQEVKKMSKNLLDKGAGKTKDTTKNEY